MKQIILFCLLCTSQVVFAQATSIGGKITDGDSGEELIGANITFYKNGILNTGTSTDFEGNYMLSLAPGTYDLEVSYIGYSACRITSVLVQAATANKLDCILGDDSSMGNSRSWRGNKLSKKPDQIPFESPDVINEPMTREELFNPPVRKTN